ncbi:hypothetical protein ACFFU9_13640 [Mariniflexile ostreae]|uniref:Uncharacterized protein n=1 Tax=Mariniflexile ostreae TaxID=1520892 RepID=A0ABV5FEM4_9FLAO
MTVLIHFKKQHLEGFNQELISQNEKFIRKEYDLDKTLMHLLNDVQAYYGQVGESTSESQISQLKTYLNLAVSGIDPISLERVKTRRRDLIRTACFHCLSNLGDVLRHSLQTVEDLLFRASETIHQLILSAFQSKLLTDALIKKTDNIEKCTALWKSLKTNEQISLIDKKLKLDILQEDISILIDMTFSKLKN